MKRSRPIAGRSGHRDRREGGEDEGLHPGRIPERVCNESSAVTPDVIEGSLSKPSVEVFY